MIRLFNRDLPVPSRNFYGWSLCHYLARALAFFWPRRHHDIAPAPPSQYDHVPRTNGVQARGAACVPRTRLAICLLASLTLIKSAAAQEPTIPPPDAPLSTVTWDERFYNPTALPDDLILPTPCGGAMAFRP